MWETSGEMSDLTHISEEGKPRSQRGRRGDSDLYGSGSHFLNSRSWSCRGTVIDSNYHVEYFFSYNLYLSTNFLICY